MCDLFLTALPKTGTHLMRQLLNTEPFPDTLIPQEEQDVVSYYRPNEYKKRISLAGDGRRHQHIPFTPERAKKLKNAVGFMIVRDPRDVIVSHAHYVERLPDETWINYRVEGWRGRLSDISLSERIDYLIKIMCARLDAYNGWAYQENVHIFKYRELVTNREAQVRRMMGILGSLNDATFDEMLDRARPQPAGAFRRGKVGDYKHTFTKQQLRDAERAFGCYIEAWS